MTCYHTTDQAQIDALSKAHLEGAKAHNRAIAKPGASTMRPFPPSTGKGANPHTSEADGGNAFDEACHTAYAMGWKFASDAYAWGRAMANLPPLENTFGTKGPFMVAFREGHQAARADALAWEAARKGGQS